MTKLELGQTHPSTGEPGSRDAFHSPCVLVYCEKGLMAGDRVKFADTCREQVIKWPDGNDDIYDAVVDPFVNGPITPWNNFWVLLRPSLVKNLTHNFAIGDETEDEAKRKNNIEPEDDPNEDADDWCTQDGC